MDRNNPLAHPNTGREVLTPHSIFRWFAPPELPRPNLHRCARALWIASWPLFAVVTVLLAIAVMVEPDTLARRATTVAAVGALVVILHAISRAGRPVLASWMLVTGLSIIVTQRAWITGGIHAPVAVFYALFIVMAGVLLGMRGGLVTATVCFLGAIVLTIGTSLRLLTAPPGAGSLLGAFVFVVLAIGLALVIDTVVTVRRRREVLDSDAVQMLVHDMRSPLQVMLAHLELLREDIRGDSVEDVEGAIGGAARLNRMTNSLLDMSRLQAGRMPVQRSVIDLSALAQSVVSSVRVLQPTRNIAVETRGDAECNCDPELTRRIIENLVSNALKHTARDGQVRVVISGSSNKASIAVNDEGPGVAPEKRSRIFEPYSAEGLKSSTGYGSSGLGLAFCRLAVEAQGGAIRIEDVVPRGSAFVVELPR